MAGSLAGAYATAAKRCGLPVDEWLARRAAGQRRCYRCREWKPADEFSGDVSRNGGRASICKPCTSDATTASRYGLTIGELAAMREKQDGRCAICERPSGHLHVDHNHATGAVRALLCPRCNSAIGALNEDPALFAAAVKYLEDYRG
jgi:hypothetical protein